jgi:hypothetical protein
MIEALDPMVGILHPEGFIYLGIAQDMIETPLSGVDIKLDLRGYRYRDTLKCDDRLNVHIPEGN